MEMRELAETICEVLDAEAVDERQGYEAIQMASCMRRLKPSKRQGVRYLSVPIEAGVDQRNELVYKISQALPPNVAILSGPLDGFFWPRIIAGYYSCKYDLFIDFATDKSDYDSAVYPRIAGVEFDRNAHLDDDQIRDLVMRLFSMELPSVMKNGGPFPPPTVTVEGETITWNIPK